MKSSTVYAASLCTFVRLSQWPDLVSGLIYKAYRTLKGLHIYFLTANRKKTFRRIFSYKFGCRKKTSNDFLASKSSSFRPGHGFWVYGIPGHFNSGIWYFLVKTRVYFCFGVPLFNPPSPPPPPDFFSYLGLVLSPSCLRTRMSRNSSLESQVFVMRASTGNRLLFVADTVFFKTNSL